MSEEVKLTAQELKQRLLNRIDAARKEVEELSEEELESIAGGYCYTAGSSDDPAMNPSVLRVGVAKSMPTGMPGGVRRSGGPKRHITCEENVGPMRKVPTLSVMP